MRLCSETSAQRSGEFTHASSTPRYCWTLKLDFLKLKMFSFLSIPGMGGSGQHPQEGRSLNNLLPWGEWHCACKVAFKNCFMTYKHNYVLKPAIKDCCRLCQLTIVPQSERCGFKRAAAFQVSLTGLRQFFFISGKENNSDVRSDHWPSLFFLYWAKSNVMITQEPDGDPWPGPGEGALQPLPWHQRELHRAAQVRSGSSCEGVVNPIVPP